MRANITTKGDAELVYGGFRNKTPPAARTQIYAATKWCIFSPLGHSVTNEWVLNAVKERSRRLGGRVELLQFHWYDVSVTGINTTHELGTNNTTV